MQYAGPPPNPDVFKKCAVFSYNVGATPKQNCVDNPLKVAGNADDIAWPFVTGTCPVSSRKYLKP